MGAVVLDDGCGFKYFNLISISSSNLSCICAAVNAADLHILMTDARDDLHPLKSDR